MRNAVVNSLGLVLWAVVAASVIGGTIAMPVIGTLIGLVIGAAVTGAEFVLISINSHLAEINKKLGVQDAGVTGTRQTVAASPSENV